jgi:hypothetical protein
MKKNLIALLLVSGLYTAVFSQSKGTTQFGITVGYNGATIVANTNNDAFSTNYKSGFNAGLTAEHYFSDSWSIKSKLLYEQKGWGNGYLLVNANTLITSYTVTNYQVNYLTIPVLANWHFGHTKNWYLNFGPYLGFLLNAKATNGNLDVKQYFNSADVGLDVGIGIKFPIATKTKFFIEINGSGGITDVSNDNVSGYTFRNSVSSINVGLNF